MSDTHGETPAEAPRETPHETPREIRLEIEVPGSVDQVWQAIATGPGITSWYVPHQVEERPGGAAQASFGEGPGMQIPGRVAAWEPPHRIVFTGVDDGPGLAFEWLVEARDGGSCVVRLVNTGFGDGAEWDDLYDGMQEGWQLFLLNLRLHLEHFRGMTATPALPTTTWPIEPAAAWRHLGQTLGVPGSVQMGDRVALDPGPPLDPEPGARLAGVVADAADGRLILVLDEPAPGTAIVAVEGRRAPSAVSVWCYLYGDRQQALAGQACRTWQAWLTENTPA